MKRKHIFLLMAFLFSLGWQLNAQFTEDFEGATFPPTGWVKELPGSANDITQSSSQNHTTGGTYSARFSSYNNSSDYNQYLFTGAITVQAGVNDQISFWHRKYNTSAETLEWGISTNGQSSADVTTWTAVTLDDTSWQKTTVDLSQYVGQTIYFAWHYYGNYLYYVYLDDVVNDAIPACAAPTNLSASNISTTQADLSWTAGGNETVWNIEYGPQGFTPGQGTTILGVTNPYTLTGLTSGTVYDYYVQADCGNGSTSTWAGPYSFMTKCDPVAAPWSEDLTTSNDLSCWTQTSGIGSYVWGYASSGTNAGGAAAGELQANFANGTGITRLVSRPLDLSSLTTPYLSFTTMFDDYASGITAKIQTSIDNGNTWVDENWSYASGGGNIPAGTVINLSLSNFGANTLIAWTLDGDHYQFDHWYIDDISVTEAPTCLDPSDLTASNITTTQAELSWTENGSATVYNIELGPQGFSPTGNPTNSGVSNPFTVTGLTAGTVYDYYVQADCSAGGGTGQSGWVGPYTFATLCDAITSFPYNYGFEDVASNSGANWLSSCWSGEPQNTGADEYSGPYRWTVNDGGTPSGSTGPSSANSGSQYAYTEASGSSDGDIASLYSPTFDMTSLTAPQISFFYHMYGSDMGTLSLDTYDGNAWTNDVWTLSGQQQTSDTDPWVKVTVDVANTVTQFRFRAVRGNGYTSDMAIDDVEVAETPTCPSPSDLSAFNILTHQAELSWTAGGNETSWNIEYGTTGFTQGSGTTVSGVSNPYTLTGLASGTIYDYYVQADCGGGDTSTWVGPYTFETKPSCGDTFYDDGGASGDYSSYMNQTMTIYPENPGDVVTVTFNSFDMEQGWDGMMVYNGPGTNYPPISSGSSYNRSACPNGAWTGGAGDSYTADGQSFTSTDPSGALTFVFTSDGSVQHAGWDATITCNPAPACNAIVPDYTQDFMVYKPACWKEAKGDDNSLNYVNSRWTYDGFLNHDISGAARIYMYGTQANINDWLISPSFDLSGGNYELSFKVGITGFSNSGGANMGADDTVELKYSTDGGATWQVMATWDANNNPTNMGDPYAFDLSALSGNSNIMFAYHANTGTSGQGGYNFYVDDFVISATSCPVATNLNATITSETSVNLSWMDNTSGTASYIVEWKPVNSTTWSSYTTAAGATSYSLTGLTPDMEYQWRLTTDCSGNGSGVTVVGSNFIPTCIPIVPDYLQEFTTYLDNCWSEAKGTMTSNFPANSRWTNDGFANNGTTGAARIRLYNNAYDSWLISPEFDLSQGSYVLTMDIAVTKFSGTAPSPMGADDEVNVQVSTDGGATWQVLQVIADANNVPSNQGTQVSIDLSNYNGLTMFAIVASDGSNAELAYNFYVDNFAITNSAVKPGEFKPVDQDLTDVNIGQNNQYFKLSTTNHRKMLNVTAYDLSGREIYRAQNVNVESLESQINISKGSIIIFRIEMSNHKIIIKKSIKL